MNHSIRFHGIGNQGSAMKIEKILSFLTYPGKNAEEQSEISGAIIPKKGKLFNMLSAIFQNSESDCNIPIIFISEDDDQVNEVREEIQNLISTKSVSEGRVLAERLQHVTTSRSGMGLLFFTLGTSGDQEKLVISRFPADEGIVAERKSKTLKVEFVEEVFMKSAYSYKSAMYKGQLSDSDFWTGFAVDKQVSHGAREIAGYWINAFLKSDFQTTPRQGTKRLALALKSAISNCSDTSIKHEITSSAKLARNIPAKAMTIAEFCDQFHLSVKAKEMVCDQVKIPRLLNDKFIFERSEFDKHISYKMVELDNGAILTAQASKFDDCFDSEVTEIDGKYRYSTTGKIVDEKLKRTK